MTRLSLRHIVFIAGPGSTHVRPAINTCLRLATRFPNSFFSIYTLGAFADQGTKHLSTCSHPSSKRVRVVGSLRQASVSEAFDVFAEMDRAFGPWIAHQLANPFAEVNGWLVDAPSYIIEDHLSGGVSLVNRQYHNLPVASWWAAGAASFLGHFGNARCGGGWRILGAMSEALDNQATGDQKSIDAILSQELTNRVVRIPGLPSHYEHEQLPQTATGTLLMFTKIYKRCSLLSEETTIVAFSSVHEIERQIAEACRDALTKPLTGFFTGFAVDIPRIVPQFDPFTPDVVLSFMNRAHTELGSHSVVYVGFGTSWFPPSGLHLRILIEEALLRGLRIVFSAKSENLRATGIDGGYISTIIESGQAIFPEWVKQLEVLEHPALHYFVSHGGWNSTTEAIVRGVPLIFWPILGDQPMNALQFSRQLDCGFELLQVRTGVAQSVAFNPNGDIPISGSAEAVRDEMRQVFEMSQGERGAQQRSNVWSLREKALAAMEAGGSGDLGLESFGKAIGL